MKKIKSLLQLNSVVFILISSSFMCMFSSCFEAEKACLDINAINFEPSADESCCCNYPLLKANILHRVNDTIPLVLDTRYENGIGDTFAILDFAFYLSDFTVYRQSEPFYVQDTVTIGELSGVDTIFTVFRDDMITVQRDDASIHNIDTFPYQGFFSDISFRIGLKDSLDNVLFNKAPSGHVLGSNNKGLYDSNLNTYSGMTVTLERTLPPMMKDTVTLNFSSDELPSDIHRLTSTQLEQAVGFDLTITIKFDYSIWFSNVDMQADENSIKAQILQNIEAGISVYQ